MKGEDNDTRKQYESIINDQRFQKLKTTLKKESPELSGQLDYFFAHAANSIYGRKPIGSKQSSPTLNPPRTGPSGSARSDKGPTKTAKALKDLQSRFRTSGNARDFAEMRKLQMANRR